MGGLGPVFDGQSQLIADGHTVPSSIDPAAWTVWTETTGFRARIGVPLLAGERIVGGFFAASVTPGRIEALRRSKGNKSEATATLGLSRTRFYTLLRRYGVK
jgi:transcriptional regulator of acetoin/glycerol metabolism